MKVAYLVNQYPKVSHSFIRREIRALERQGWTVQRYAIRGWDEPQADPADAEEAARTRWLLRGGAGPLMAAATRTVLRRPRAAARALAAALAMARRSVRPWPVHLVWFAEACLLRDWLAQEGIGHLHAHFGTNSADVAHLVARLGGPGYSFTLHGPDEFDSAPSMNLPRKVGGARFVVAISAYTRAQAMRHVPPEDWPRLRVVHCGLEPDFGTAAPAPLPDGPVLLCIGRLCAQKGHLILLEALAALDRPEVRLVLAGDGPLRAQVAARAAALGLAGQVHITGWIGSDTVRDLIGGATLIVQPSLMEGLPVALMEAQALGRVVVTTQVAGIPELVQDGRTGWLVAPGDAAALAQAIGAALDCAPDVLRAMGRAGAARVRDRHDIDREAARLGALFQAALQGALPEGP